MPEGAQINRPLIAVATALAVVVVDQLSKTLLTSSLSPYESVEIIPGFFNLVSVRNPGAAFGIFSGGGAIILTLISLVAIVVIAFLISKATKRGAVLALALIGGGAAGNLIDRIRYGEVVDFLDFYVGGFHWPAFNAADSAITVGVVLYLIFSYRGGSDGEKEESCSNE